MIVSVLWMLLGLASAAEPDSPEDWVGLPIASVVPVAPEGGLPEESLDPLLQAKQGQPFDPKVIRLDLVTLYRIGAFRAVEAHVEPALTYDAQGNEQQGVMLTYEVYPAPEVGSITVTGATTFRDREILDMAGVSPGQGTWFPKLEVPRLEDRIENALYRKGWTRAKVTVTAERDEDDRLALTIDVKEGQPNVLEQLSFAGDIERVDGSRNQRRLRRWARKAGVVEGEPFDPEAIRSAQDQIRTELARVRTPFFQPNRGWINARVTPALMRTGAGTARVTFTIESGPQLVLEDRKLAVRQKNRNIQGLGFGGRRLVESSLGIDERLRLTRGWLDEAPDRLTTALQAQGFQQASVEVQLEQKPDLNQVHLKVKADKGPRHLLRRRFVAVTFEGNSDDTLDDAALMRVLDQASEDVIRLDYYNQAELEKGLKASSQVYRARGHLEAELQLESAETHLAGWWPFKLLRIPIRRLFFPNWEPPLRVEPVVTVTEGPLTTVSEIEVVGLAADADTDDLEEALNGMAGEAFSPQGIELITRRLVEAHKAEGYLEADARIETATVEPLVRSVRVTVEPGVQVLLRSKVTRGLKRTKPSFVRREADIELGEPVTPAALDRVRANLYDLDIFRSVKLVLLGDETARDLLIDVTERPRYGYELGFGLSTDQGIRSFGRFTTRNLWGRAHRIDVIGQIGLIYGSDAITDWIPDITQPDWRLAVSYTAPRFPARSQQLVFDVVRERRLERTWRMARMGGGVALETEFARKSGRKRETNLRIAPRIETRQLQEIDVGALLPGEPWLERIEAGLPSLWRVQESLNVLFLVDRRDDRILPRKGVLLSTTGELAPGLPWDEWRDQDVTRFLKGEVRLTSYVPLGGFVLEVQGAAGHAFPLDDDTVIPLEDRFRLGGTGSMRGYVRDSVGPRNRASRVDIAWPSGISPLVDYATRDDPERWVPTGGDTRATTTIELLMPLPALGLPGWEGYALELFADIGNVWLLGEQTQATTDEPEFASQLPPYRVGVGGGVQVATPVGPLQVDIGVNPQAAWAADPTVREFLTGQFEEPRVRVHLTLGATF